MFEHIHIKHIIQVSQNLTILLCFMCERSSATIRRVTFRDWNVILSKCSIHPNGFTYLSATAKGV